MKYKLHKAGIKLQGNFTVGMTYNAYSYNDAYWVIEDNSGKGHLINIKTPIFEDHFVNIKKERKEKLENIEKNTL